MALSLLRAEDLFGDDLLDFLGNTKMNDVFSDVETDALFSSFPE